VSGRNTLLLAIVFILLGIYVYLFELKKSEDKGERLLDFKADEVEGLTLTYPTEEIRLKKMPAGKWQITHPLSAPADESTIGNLLSLLNTSEVKRTIEERPTPEDLKNFGLDQPQVKVAVTLRKGKALPPILVGGKSALGYSVYVRRGSESGVLLTSASVLSNLEKKPADLRDRTILDFRGDAVKRLSLEGAKGSFALTQKGAEWFLERPRPWRADQAEVKGMLSTLRRMSAQDFLEGSLANLKKYGLDRPRLRVTVFEEEKDARHEILFGHRRQEKNQVYVALNPEGRVYTVPESVFKELDKDLLALRDKEVFPFARDQVVKLSIHRPGETLILVPGERGEWRVEAPKKAKASKEGVAAYLAALSDLRANGFASDDLKDTKRYGLQPPSLRITLAGKDGKNLAGLFLGGKIQGRYYAQREGRPTIYAIEESAFHLLDKRLTDFLEFLEEKKERK